MTASAPLLTMHQVCEQLAIGRTCVYRLIHAGQLPKPQKVGGASRWRLQDVERLKFGRGELRRRGKRKGEAGATREG